MNIFDDVITNDVITEIAQLDDEWRSLFWTLDMISYQMRLKYRLYIELPGGRVSSHGLSRLILDPFWGKKHDYDVPYLIFLIILFYILSGQLLTFRDTRPVNRPKHMNRSNYNNIPV